MNAVPMFSGEIAQVYSEHDLDYGNAQGLPALGDNVQPTLQEVLYVSLSTCTA